MAKSLSETLRAAMVESGRSVKALATAAGLDHAPLIRFKNRSRTLTLRTADKLAAVLNLNLQASSTGRRRKKTDS